MRIIGKLFFPTFGVFFIISLFFLGALTVEAHRSGCHRWHSCPSDSGSYTCGDAGYPCQYPTYPASGGVIYPPSGYYKDCYDCALKKVPDNGYTSGITFSCNAGYLKIGDSCVKKATSSNSSGYSSTNSLECPANSSESLTDSTKCTCNSGYQANFAKNACISVAEQNSVCSRGNNNDPYIFWNGTYTNDGLLNCACRGDYQWNSEKKACLLPSNTKNPEKEQSISALQAQIKALLDQLAALQNANN